MLVNDNRFFLAERRIILGRGATWPRNAEHSVNVAIFSLIEMLLNRVAIVFGNLHDRLFLIWHCSHLLVQISGFLVEVGG
jgi:hypothetical protein